MTRWDISLLLSSLHCHYYPQPQDTWTLTLRNVQTTDRGPYMCQVNSTPVKSQVAYLEVVIPPRIKDDQSSTDVAVPEGGSVKLHCKAVGFPEWVNKLNNLSICLLEIIYSNLTTSIQDNSKAKAKSIGLTFLQYLLALYCYLLTRDYQYYISQRRYKLRNYYYSRPTVTWKRPSGEMITVRKGANKIKCKIEVMVVMVR